MWGAAPHPAHVKRKNARLRLALRPCGNYICVVSPRTLAMRQYMGLCPKPHSRTFLGKSPRDPKKPDWVGFILSSIDSKQGCRTAALLFVRRRQYGTAIARCPAHTHRPHAARTRPSCAETLKLRTFSFFAKHFKLYRQLAERK